MTLSTLSYPFSALVGQDEMRLALLLNAINPAIGGVLIRGEKGTAKSTAARGLATLLSQGYDPPLLITMRSTTGDTQQEYARPVGNRFVELPVGAGDDRVLGTLDIEAALQEGRRAFEPGLLAHADGGVLYVDEVNLLPDHIVDILLDSAASGVNTVEREGISVSHRARFLLIGTMNPEEGELRPQLLDRFGLAVDVVAPAEPALRAAVVRRRIAFEADPLRFAADYAAADQALAARIQGAAALVPEVSVSEGMLSLITDICIQSEVDGLRADITLYKSAQTLAAWNERTTVQVDDVRQAARLVLLHRRRRQPFEEPGIDQQALDGIIQNHAPQNSPRGNSRNRIHLLQKRVSEQAQQQPTTAPGEAAPDQTFSAANPFRVRTELLKLSQRGTNPAVGRRQQGADGVASGHAIRSRRPDGIANDLALGATIRAAALRGTPDSGQTKEQGADRARLRIAAGDLRIHVRRPQTGNLILFVVDASGSMGARKRMVAVKGAVLSLLLDAYQRRDRVGLIAFRGAGAELLVPPTNSVELAERSLRRLPTGGRTPLTAGLVLADQVLERHQRQRLDPLLVLITDGKSNSGQPPHRIARHLAEKQVRTLVLDSEEGYVRLRLAQQLATALAAPCIPLDDLRADTIQKQVKRALAKT